MTGKAAQIATALVELGDAIEGSIGSEQKLSDFVGWAAPPLDRHDLKHMAVALAEQVQLVEESDIKDGLDPAQILDKITWFRNQTIPQLWGGNASQASNAYFFLLEFIRTQFSSILPAKIDWNKLDDRDLVPRSIKQRLRGLNAHISDIVLDTDDLSNRITVINDAYDAAQSLPTDLASLAEARESVANFRRESERDQVLIREYFDQVGETLSRVRESEAEARKLVENTEDAYSAATTKGLGEAFQIRADRTARSMWVCVVGLLCALGLGAWLGAQRVEMIERLLQANASSNLIALHMGLAFISVAAPVWFAWIATKQIGQRFRLSEDYAFKASVAKAYEGYRREAARVDPDFASRLFRIALDRLDEAPLRFVEHETFGSPWHEFWAIRRARHATQGATDRSPEAVVEPSRATAQSMPDLSVEPAETGE
jgi:hypothetical protein